MIDRTASALMCLRGCLLAVLIVSFAHAEDPPSYDDGKETGTIGSALCKYSFTGCSHYDSTCQAADKLWTCNGYQIGGVKNYHRRSIGQCTEQEPKIGESCDYWNPIQCEILDFFFEPPSSPFKCTTHLCYDFARIGQYQAKFCAPKQP